MHLATLRHSPRIGVVGACTFLLALGGIGLIPLTASAAGVVVDSSGFESPGFSTGVLQGQQGWVRAGGAATTATVQNSIANAGSQAVRVDRGASADAYFARRVVGFPTQRFVAVDWDMLVIQSFSGGLGPFFGVAAFDDRNETSIQASGTLGVDATSGEILYQAEGTGVLTDMDVTVSFNQWHHYRLLLDFSLSQYRIIVNDVLLKTEGFVDAGADEFTDADISAFAVGFDSNSQMATGTAYFDNFLVRDGLRGDYDVDGDVDAADYDVWKLAFGSLVSTAGNLADGSGNGVVDAADYNVWRDNLGATFFPSPGAASVVAGSIPEPATCWFLLTAWGTLASRRFRR